jgi:hypothetical protein
MIFGVPDYCAAAAELFFLHPSRKPFFFGGSEIMHLRFGHTLGTTRVTSAMFARAEESPLRFTYGWHVLKPFALPFSGHRAQDVLGPVLP